jgi:hypothetical protein
MQVQLSPKAIRFIIEAIEFHHKHHEERLCTPGISEDEASDLRNDQRYLEAIKSDLLKYQDRLLAKP